MGQLTKLTTNSFKDGEVKTANIGTGAVGTDELASCAVNNTNKITNGEITATDLASTLDLSSKTLTLPTDALDNQHFNVALLGFDKVTISVSLDSSIESSMMPDIFMVPLVAPALIVKVPLARVKSVPDPVAVPVTA